MERGRGPRLRVPFLALAAACALPLGPQARAGALWLPPTTLASGSGQYSSLQIDSGGRLHIACRNHVQRDLLYLRQADGGAWVTETVDASGDVGRFASMALTSDDRPFVAYLDFTNGRLKLAERTGSGWVIETVPGAQCSGWYCSLSLDSSDAPHIAFSACASPALYYASRSSEGEWTVEAVDTSADVGLYASLKLWNDSPRVSYYDRTNGRLKYAERQSSGWSIVTVDTAERVGLDTSLALDESGDPHITYWDQKNGFLKYAWREAGVWTVETVDAEPYGGYESCLSLAGGVRVSYEGAGGLRYAERIDGCWRIWKLDEGHSAAGYTSLAVRSSGNPVISCFRLASQSLQVYEGISQAQAMELAGEGVSSPGAARRLAPGVCARAEGVVTSAGGPAGWWIQAVDRSGALELKMPSGCALPGQQARVQMLGLLESGPSGGSRMQVCSWENMGPAAAQPLLVSRPHPLADGLLATCAGIVGEDSSGLRVGAFRLAVPTSWTSPSAGVFGVVTGILRVSADDASIMPRSPDEVVTLVP